MQDTQARLPQPLVSFIITTYNLPVSMLNECIESIRTLSLSTQERQIILVDDGSETSPIDALTQRDDIVYLRQSNQGLSAARNLGLQCATGAYVQFIDGDDYLIAPPYEHCLDLVRYEHPDMVLFLLTDNPQPATPFRECQPLGGNEYMRQYNIRASACGYIFSRKALGSLRFATGLLHEDEDFTPQLMLRCERLFDTGAEAYYYRQRESSITHTTDNQGLQKRLADTERIIMHLHNLAQESPESDRTALNRRVAQLSMDYLYNTIVLTHSHKQLMRAIQTLRAQGLFPLPDKKYTRKYTAFRKLIGNAAGRWMLLMGLR